MPSGMPRFRGPRGRSRSCRIRQVSFAAAIRLRGFESGSLTWSKSVRRMTQPLARPIRHRPLRRFVRDQSIDNHPIALFHDVSFSMRMRCSDGHRKRHRFGLSGKELMVAVDQIDRYLVLARWQILYVNSAGIARVRSMLWQLVDVNVHRRRFIKSVPQSLRIRGPQSTARQLGGHPYLGKD